MKKPLKYDKRNYGKKNHDIKTYIDEELDTNICNAVDKLNATGPYMKLRKTDFFRLALEVFCGEVNSGEFMIGITFKKKEKCGEVKDGKR